MSRTYLLKPSIVLLFFMLLVGCHRRNRAFDEPAREAALLHAAETELTEVMVYDIFAPPVASRIYAYSTLAAYEAVRFERPGFQSITARLRGFEPMPRPEQKKVIDFSLASLTAFCEVAKVLVFSTDRIDDYEAKIQIDYETTGLDQQVMLNSIAYGKKIALTVLTRAAKDRYKETRGMPRYTVENKDGIWKPTAPDYMDAVEPNFGKITPFILDSAGQFKPAGPYLYSLNKNSAYYRDLIEVYNTSLHAGSEQQEQAAFWDCNPYVAHHTGHLMLASKKISPGGHWIGITGIACKQIQADLPRSAFLYSWVSVAMFDGFISCWQAKYETRTVRPETVIEEKIDPSWRPLLQCPPFPNYPSGHSVISAAAAAVLTHLLGPNFTYTDSVERAYGLPPRKYNSFEKAAQEAMISRMYGGIHERKACTDGFQEGEAIGKLVIRKNHLHRVNLRYQQK